MLAKALSQSLCYGVTNRCCISPCNLFVHKSSAFRGTCRQNKAHIMPQRKAYEIKIVHLFLPEKGDLFLEKQWLQKSDVSFQYDFTCFALENEDVDNDVIVRIISSWILLFWGGAAVFCLIFTLSVLRRYNRALFLQLSSWGYKADIIYLINSTIRFQSQSRVMHENLALCFGLGQ